MSGPFAVAVSVLCAVLPMFLALAIGAAIASRRLFWTACLVIAWAILLSIGIGVQVYVYDTYPSYADGFAWVTALSMIGYITTAVIGFIIALEN